MYNSNYSKLNNLLGWLVFIFATAVYVLTIEPTASFWDCGEFIACSYKLQVPHPPGAPFFLLIGRIFSLLASDVTQVAFWINMVSALSSSFSVLFLFWTITLIARKFAKDYQNPTLGEKIAIFGSGVVGSLAFTFSDSFWFSAVEAEVYAMSQFFTAFVFWAILKWETKAEQIGADKWLLLIAYTIGLSIGVHLLNLLAIPALAFVYYFKKYDITRVGVISTFLISGVIIVVVLSGIIPGLPSLAGTFEIFFVNSLGLPFNSGIIFFGILFLSALVFGIVYSIKNQKYILNLSLLGLTFILIGYASYGIILVRSNFDPPIDENDPENVISFVSYLKREQYGDRPIFKGPLFTAGYPIDVEKGSALYRKDSASGQYVVYDYKMNYIYDPKHVTLFPRAYSTQPHHVEAYRSMMNLREGKKPSFWQDKGYMFSYQIGHMYLRYLGWNFIGRASDIQDSDVLWPWDHFKKDLPEYLKNNKARNNFFLLPFILGVVGFVYLFSKSRKDGIVVSLLFIFTGLAIVVYLNQPPVEPRERDYTFAGSFYAFAIWIGLGVFFIADLMEKIIKSESTRSAISFILCLSVPAIMGQQGWDDHDRSNRFYSVDSAKNLLNSCAPNAILFTGGDNDTFPLWYVQEVEGFRTDVRVCNLSLLNTDWYIKQMKQQAYESEPLPISLNFENYIQGKNDQIYFVEKPQYKSGINLAGYIQLVKTDNPEIRQESGRGDYYTTLPSKNLYLNIDKNAVLATGAVPDTLRGQVLDRLAWNIGTNTLEKKDLIILDMIVTNNWKRPIYFSTTLSGSNFLNLKDYTQLEGLAHRLMPIKYPNASQGFVYDKVMYDNMMKNFFWRELDNPNVYYDENYFRMTVNSRSQFYRLASTLYNNGEIEKAKEVAEHCFKVMPDDPITYDIATPPFIQIFFKTGNEKMAMDIANKMGNRAIENLEYYKREKIPYGRDYELNFYILDSIIRALKEGGKAKEAAKYEEVLMSYSYLFNQ